MSIILIKAEIEKNDNQGKRIKQEMIKRMLQSIILFLAALQIYVTILIPMGAPDVDIPLPFEVPEWLFEIAEVDAGNRGSMFCDGGIVGAGDPMEDALVKCGQPDLIFTGTEEYQKHPNGNYSKDTVITWTYNFGSHEFLRRVIIYRGRILRIEAGDKGWD